MATKAKFKMRVNNKWVEYDFGGTVDLSNYVTLTALNTQIETLQDIIKNTYATTQDLNRISTTIASSFLTKDDASKTYATIETTNNITSSLNGIAVALATNTYGFAKTSSVGQANGIAPLDATGKIASSYLPSYVDDVLEYTNRGSFPTTGETGKIYINISDGRTYRWSGSTYSEISASLALGETSSTAYAGDKGKANADAIAAIIDGSQYVQNAVDADSAMYATEAGSVAWAHVTGKPSSYYTLPTATSSTLGGVKISNGDVYSVYHADGLAAGMDHYHSNYLTEHQSLSGYATQTWVNTQISNLVNSAPEALNTLGELATALESHEDEYDALLSTVGGKLDKSSVSGTSGYIPKFSGTNSIGNSVISQAASNKTTIGGKLVVNAGADTSSGNCDEGIRVLPASGWAELFLSNDTSTTGTGGWLVARRGSAGTTSGTVGDFTIEYGGWQGNGLTLYANGNRPRWKNNELAYKSDIPTNYVTTDGSAEQTISGNKRFTGNNNIFTGTVAINSILLTREQSAIFLHDEDCQKFLDIFGYDSDHSDNTHGWMYFGNTESGTSLLSKINPTWSSPNGNYDILTSAGGSITGNLYVSNEVETKNVYAANEVYAEGNIVSEGNVRAGDIYFGHDAVHLTYDSSRKAIKFVFA